jgi:hypothetical protein
MLSATPLFRAGFGPVAEAVVLANPGASATFRDHGATAPPYPRSRAGAATDLRDPAAEARLGDDRGGTRRLRRQRHRGDSSPLVVVPRRPRSVRRSPPAGSGRGAGRFDLAGADPPRSSPNEPDGRPTPANLEGADRGVNGGRVSALRRSFTRPCSRRTVGVRRTPAGRTQGARDLEGRVHLRHDRFPAFGEEPVVVGGVQRRVPNGRRRRA